VLLSETRTQPQLPIFLRNRHWVDFRLQNPDPCSQLIWGITGKRPDNLVVTAEAIPSQEVEQFSLIEKTVLDARYADLERYLKNGHWEEADEETYRLMIAEVGKEVGQWFGSDDLQNFPCEPLRTIDSLWAQHSGGKFGFTAQKKIYLECGGVHDGPYDDDAFNKFCHANGWKVKSQWVSSKFDTTSPNGHLPVFGGRLRRSEWRFVEGWDTDGVNAESLKVLDRVKGGWASPGASKPIVLSSLISRLAICNL
jgi:GUN4-like